MTQSASVSDSTRYPSDIDGVWAAARRLSGATPDYDLLMELIGAARFVLLGAGTDGTREFYRERGEITKRLIQEKGFTAIAVEADWPDAHRVDRYVRGPSNDDSAVEALGAFSRFPSWLWRNTEAVALIEWLRAQRSAG